MQKILSLALFCAINATYAVADTAPNTLYITTQSGIGLVGDQSGTGNSADDFSGNWNTTLDTGYFAGFGVGYLYNDKLSGEIYWEYRSNDAQTRVSATGNEYSGNYASSTIYFNTYYHFASFDNWRPYAGLGLGYLQEIDIDLELAGIETSYSGDGDLGLQAIIGANYSFADRLDLSLEARYARFSSTELTGEGMASGTIDGFDYDPMSIAIGLKYRF
ncbi:MAG: outer membrane beta-barrel protein [Alteromonadaceae bacterium]|nr:outer membrane beta-barrel protein [Alteromonadaceae bacterium]